MIISPQSQIYTLKSRLTTEIRFLANYKSFQSIIFRTHQGFSTDYMTDELKAQEFPQQQLNNKKPDKSIPAQNISCF